MSNFSLVEFGAKVGLFFIPFLFALCFHEYAHGFIAKLKGDRTAELMGRLTLNPLVHMDPIGTFLLPLAALQFGFPFFGWAKPVPVNERNLRKPKEDMFWVALAGPLSNILLALVGWILIIAVLVIFQHQGAGVALFEMLKTFIFINLALALFNLIPLHPLDGGKVLARFIPYQWNRTLEENQGTLQMILIVLFVVGGFRIIFAPVALIGEALIRSAIVVASL